MINAKELRIGNIVRGTVGGDTWKLTPRMILSISIGEAEVDPIPLTKEILEKYGFEEGIYKGEAEYFLVLRNGITEYKFVFYPENDIKAVILLHKGLMIGGNSYYLHQIQNLYFALTSNELTF